MRKGKGKESDTCLLSILLGQYMAPTLVPSSKASHFLSKNFILAVLLKQCVHLLLWCKWLWDRLEKAKKIRAQKIKTSKRYTTKGKNAVQALGGTPQLSRCIMSITFFYYLL